MTKEIQPTDQIKENPFLLANSIGQTTEELLRLNPSERIAAGLQILQNLINNHQAQGKITTRDSFFVDEDLGMIDADAYYAECSVEGQTTIEVFLTRLYLPDYDRDGKITKLTGLVPPPFISTPGEENDPIRIQAFQNLVENTHVIRTIKQLLITATQKPDLFQLPPEQIKLVKEISDQTEALWPNLHQLYWERSKAEMKMTIRQEIQDFLTLAQKYPVGPEMITTLQGSAWQAVKPEQFSAFQDQITKFKLMENQGWRFNQILQTPRDSGSYGHRLEFIDPDGDIQSPDQTIEPPRHSHQQPKRIYHRVEPGTTEVQIINHCPPPGGSLSKDPQTDVEIIVRHLSFEELNPAQLQTIIDLSWGSDGIGMGISDKEQFSKMINTAIYSQPNRYSIHIGKRQSESQAKILSLNDR